MARQGAVRRSPPARRLEVVRAVRSARLAEPELDEDDVLSLVVENTGVPLPLVRIAVGYWASYSTEIEAEISAADGAEAAAEAVWRRERDLLAASSWQPRFSLMRC